MHTPFKSLLPMADPNDLVLGGWDISNLNLAESMERAKVSFPRLHVFLSPCDRHFMTAWLRSFKRAVLPWGMVC